jgi:hypothetical protein
LVSLLAAHSHDKTEQTWSLLAVPERYTYWLAAHAVHGEQFAALVALE